MSKFTNRPPESIVSEQNPKFKTWKSLLESKGIKKQGLAILSGEKLVNEYLKSDKEVICELVQENKTAISQKPTFSLTQALFKELDTNGTHHSLLIIPAQTFQISEFGTPHGIEVIAPLQDPRNLGALIRSCAAFGVKKIHLPISACNPYHPKCLKVAANGFMHVQFFTCNSIEKICTDQFNLLKDKTYLLDAKGSDFSQARNKKNIYLVVGEEGQGIPADLKKKYQSLSIPIQNIESLNATVATSIALYELSK
jgi:TrmH family RNA methyltransferase